MRNVVPIIAMFLFWVSGAYGEMVTHLALASETKADDATAHTEAQWRRTGWNAQIKQRFMHPPVFHFTRLGSAPAYRCTIGWKENSLSQSCVVESETPEINLADVWEKLPPTGDFHVSAEAINAGGKAIGQLSFTFAKIASFTGPYRSAKSGYMESGAKAALWVLQKAGDKKAGAFPALFGSAYIRVLVTYARLHPESDAAKAALEAAKKHGESLIKASTPSHWAYANMPMSHHERMLQIPRTGTAGMAYLDLFHAIGDKQFLDGAVRIAETLKKTQLEEGRWYFRVEPETGKMLKDYTSDQVQAIVLLDELIKNHGKKDLIASRDKAVRWVLENPCKTFNWQEQWEDISVQIPYQNLEWYDTALFIEHLLQNASPQNGYEKDDYEKIALELLRYIEDQFVEWEPTGIYITPGVREQYRCYHNIDWHVAHYIRACIAFHDRTKDDVYLKKAKAMADTLTAIQHADGFYPTWMKHKPSKDNPRDLREINYGGIWANCTSYTGEMLMKLGEYTKKGSP